MAKKALGGVRVLEYCELVAGPYCTKLMADLGAEVIKIEPPGTGDKARSREPFLNDIPDPERSGLFLYLNTNKLGITLDVESLAGKTLFHQLVKNVDVVVEDKPPGLMKQLGLGYEDLKAQNPRLVMTSISPFGQTGPHAEYKAYHLNTFHSGGEGYMTPGGSTLLDRPPLKVGKHVGDYESGISAAGATLVALYHSRATGQGQHVDISKQEALMYLNTGELFWWPVAGVVVTRATRGFHIAGPIRCQDGYVEFCPNRLDEEWGRLIDFIGRPEWASDQSLENRAYREEHGEEVRDLVARASMNRTKEEIYHEAQKARVPLAPFYRLDEVVNSEQLKARQFFVEVDHKETGKIKYPLAPYQFSETPPRIDRPAPLLGEHNEEIYCRRLGYTRQDLVKFREAGTV